jgi:hypothetical protein
MVKYVGVLELSETNHDYLAQNPYVVTALAMPISENSERQIPQNGHHHCRGLARLSMTALYGVCFPQFTTYHQRKST